MSVQLIDNFDYKGSKPNFDRDVVETKQDVLNNLTYYEDGHIVYVKEDKKHYKIDKSTDSLEEIGGGVAFSNLCETITEKQDMPTDRYPISYNKDSEKVYIEVRSEEELKSSILNNGSYSVTGRLAKFVPIGKDTDGYIAALIYAAIPTTTNNPYYAGLMTGADKAKLDSIDVDSLESVYILEGTFNEDNTKFEYDTTKFNELLDAVKSHKHVFIKDDNVVIQTISSCNNNMIIFMCSECFIYIDGNNLDNKGNIVKLLPVATKNDLGGIISCDEIINSTDYCKIGVSVADDGKATVSIPYATPDSGGMMSAEDKTKLNSVEVLNNVRIVTADEYKSIIKDENTVYYIK